ncbi:hypothetical protein GCM10008986_33260 [Salinibacillus aidingensis]|uniref:Cyclic nucleotide-binding domain-containing protein n=1 Tax=Salinibacillus aidingensis TaxID=237684 RepID=A0ABN1BQR7_9BACI
MNDAPNGKEQLIRILDQGDFFGEMSIFSIYASFRHSGINGEAPGHFVKNTEEFSRRLDHTEHLVEQLSSQDVENALQDKRMIEQTGQRKIKIIDIDQLQDKTEAW